MLICGSRPMTVRRMIADVFAAYLTKPKPPNSTDVVRIGAMSERSMTAKGFATLPAGWMNK